MMRIDQFAGAAPKFSLECYFDGTTKGWGIFQDRSGNLRRQFTVEIEGQVMGDEILLDEQFAFSDGGEEARVWRIRKTGADSYEGDTSDLIGSARGQSAGNALRWRYTMRLKIGPRKWAVRFDDWMFLLPGGMLISRARVSKWGILLGELILCFMPGPAIAATEPGYLSAEASRGTMRRVTAK